jgi:hypothetical protein
MSVDSTSPTQKVDPTIGLLRVNRMRRTFSTTSATNGHSVTHSPELADPAHPAEFVGNVAALATDELRLGGGGYRVY